MNKSSMLAAIVSVALIPSSVLCGQTPDASPAPVAQAAPTIPADQQPTTEQLNKLFEVMHVRAQLASITKMMPQMMQQQFTAQFKDIQKAHPELANISEDQQKAVSKIVASYMERVMNLYTGDEMISDMAAIYRKHLAAADVDAAIAYYSSPAGEHMLDMVPAMMQEFLPVVTSRIQARIPPLIEQMTQEMEGVIKSQPSPSPQAPK